MQMGLGLAVPEVPCSASLGQFCDPNSAVARSVQAATRGHSTLKENRPLAKLFWSPEGSAPAGRKEVEPGWETSTLGLRNLKKAKQRF